MNLDRAKRVQTSPMVATGICMKRVRIHITYFKRHKVLAPKKADVMVHVLVYIMQNSCISVLKGYPKDRYIRVAATHITYLKLEAEVYAIMYYTLLS